MANQFLGLFDKRNEDRNKNVNQFADLFSDSQKKKDDEEEKRRLEEEARKRNEKPVEIPQENNPQPAVTKNDNQAKTQSYQPQGWFEEKLKEHFPAVFDSIVKLQETGRDIANNVVEKEANMTPEEKAKYEADAAIGVVKKIPGAVKGLITSNYGFSDEEIKKAEPSLTEKLSAISKYPGMVAYDLLDFGSNLLFGEQKDAQGNPISGKEVFKADVNPKSAGEAKVMQFADVGQLFLGIGEAKSLKNFFEIATKTGDTKLILSEGKKLGFAFDEATAKKMSESKTGEEVSNVLNDYLKNNFDKSKLGDKSSLVDSSIRKEIENSSKKIESDNLAGNTDDETLQQFIEKRNQFDESVNNFKESVADIPGENGKPIFNIDVVQYDDGKWGRSFNAGEENSIIHPFDPAETFSSREKAISETTSDLKKWVESEVKTNAGEMTPELQKISQEIENLKTGVKNEFVDGVGNVIKNEKSVTVDEAKQIIEKLHNETNPEVRRTLQYQLYEKSLIEKEKGIVSSTTNGRFDSAKKTVEIASDTVAKEFEDVLREEIGHDATSLLHGDKEAEKMLVDYYNSLSENDLEKIFSSGPGGKIAEGKKTLADYRKNYGNDALSMADEAVQWDMRNKSFFERRHPIVEKIREIIKQVIIGINKTGEKIGVPAFNKTIKRLDAFDLYKDLFKQEGGARFGNRSKGYWEDLKNAGHKAGNIEEIKGAIPKEKNRFGVMKNKEFSANTSDIPESKSRRFENSEKTEKMSLSTRTAQIVAQKSDKLINQTSSSYKIKDDIISTLKQSNDYKSIRQQGATLRIGEKNPGKNELFNRVKKAIFGEWWTKTREVVQDSWTRVAKLQENPDAQVIKNLNPYQSEILYHGRLSRRQEIAQEAITSIDKDIIEVSKKIKGEVVENKKDIGKSLNKEIDQYLIAQHTPERNAIHGDGASGMTNLEADKVMADLKNKSYFEDIKRISDKVSEINSQTIEILYDGQIISDEVYDTLKNSYKNHIPLQRIIPESGDVGQILTGKGFSVKGTGLKKAKGSELEVADILTNVSTNLNQAFIRAEKNRVDLATLQFARDNKALGLFEEIKPKAIGKTFDDKFILQEIHDPNVLSLRENGKPVYLKINDPKLAVALQGVGNEKTPALIKFIGAYTRFYSGMATRFNPEFAFSNKVRDLQEMAVYMASQDKIGFSGAAKTAGRDASSMKSVSEYILGKKTEGTKLYEQMMLDGGTTGGMSLSTRKQIEVDIDDIRKLNRSNPRKAKEAIIGGIDKWNTVFEDSTRLSAYKTALERGLSREEAAQIAKESTVNFNKKGTGGSIINSLYMFANASIQGSTKTLKAMKNPKVLGSIVATVGTTTFAVNKWNDSVDENWRDKVSPWDRQSNMVVMFPTSEGAKYLTIPVAWAFKPIKVGADYSYDLLSGAFDGSKFDMAKGIVASALDAYNPAGGSDLTSAVVPTFADIPVDIARNQSWAGSKIKMDSKAGVPESENYFQNKEGVPSDKSVAFSILKSGTKKLSSATGGEVEISPADMKYIYDQMIGGAGRTIAKTTETTIALSKRELPQASDVPFSSRFYKTKTDEQVEKSKTYSERDALYDELKKLNSKPEEQKNKIQEYLASLPDDKERQKQAFILRDNGFSTTGVSTSGDIIRIKPTFDKIQKLISEGNENKAQSIVNKMNDDDYSAYKKAKASDSRRKTILYAKENGPEMQKTYDEIQKLIADGKRSEAQSIVNKMSNEDYKLYKAVKDEMSGD